MWDAIAQPFRDAGETLTRHGNQLGEWATSGARAIDNFGPRVAAEVAVEYAAFEAERRFGNLGKWAVRSAPAWVPGITTAFARGLGSRAKQLVRSHGRRALGLGYDFRARKPYVPQRRFPRQFVRQSHFRDRFRSGSRAIFYERPGDWKKQFRGIGKY